MIKEDGVVSIPKSYFFKMAKLDYTKWQSALPREFYQNSVDAGASLIEVDADESSRVIRIADNGCGMDYDTIKNKLLVFGGSKKDAGSVGAFGKAKEILFFSWVKYRIRTQDWLVTGEGAKYTIEKVEDWHEGTLCSIWIWDSEDFEVTLKHFQYVAGYFEVNCQINYLGEEVISSLCRGRLARSMPWADLYIDDSIKSYYVSVRIDGQWMFEEWQSASYELGKIMLEIHGDSIQVLTSNRDGLRGEYLRNFRDLVSEIVTDTISALEPERVVVKEKFTGTGKIAVNRKKATERMTKFLKELDDEPIKVIEEVIDRVIDVLPEENITSVDMDRVEETVKRGSYWDHEDRFSFIGFQPDFHVMYEEEIMSSEKLEKYMKRRNVVNLAVAWTEVLKQVLLDVEKYVEYHVGFDFSLTVTAAYSLVDGDHYFYLNPELLLSDCQGDPKWYSQKMLLREDLILKAIHEITHLYCISHNEDFTTRAEWIRARTWKSISIYPKIIKESFVKY